MDTGLSGRRVAITGAFGFVGSHLVDLLRGSGAQVVGRDGFDADAPTLAGCDALVHLAYRPPASAASAADHLRANLDPTIRLLGAAAAAGVAHVCFASSTSVYRCGLGLTEDAAVQPSSPYAQLKLAQEARIADWAGAGGRSAAILRLSTVYGPRERRHRAIPAFIEAAVAGRPPVVAGEGRGPFDPVYVGDVADAFRLALRPGESGIFNVGAGAARAPVDVARLVSRLAGLDGSVVHDRALEDRPRPVCDIRRARRELGFLARTPIEDGLAAEIEWVRAAARGGTSTG